MLHDRDIICISSIDWDFIWQGHQEIMTTLAAQGNRVLFMENTGVRPPRPARSSAHRGTPRELAARRRRVPGGAREPVRATRRSCCRCRTRRSRCGSTRCCCCGRCDGGCARRASTRPIVWTFLPTPLVLATAPRSRPGAQRLLLHRRLRSELARRARGSCAASRSCSSDADLVFVTSEQLRGARCASDERVHLFPFGVDYPAFESVREGDEAPPADVRGSAAADRRLRRRPASVGRPGAARARSRTRMPDASVVLVGPIQTDVSTLTGVPNVHLLGARSHARACRATSRPSTSALVPYRLSEYTANVYPTKLNEYLALGIPVVATDLAEIRRFNADARRRGGRRARRGELHGRRPGGGRRDPPAEVERRVEIARSNSWHERVGRDGNADGRGAAAPCPDGPPMGRAATCLVSRRPPPASPDGHADRRSLPGTVLHAVDLGALAPPLRMAEAPRRPTPSSCSQAAWGSAARLAAATRSASSTRWSSIAPAMPRIWCSRPASSSRSGRPR